MTVIAEGYNAFETKKDRDGHRQVPEGPGVGDDAIRSGKLGEHILLVRSGTTPFLAPALTMGALGVITMSGAPESHLGILSREFQTPCVMTAHLTGSDSRYEVGGADNAHFEEIVAHLAGKTVTLDCSDSDVGRIVDRPRRTNWRPAYSSTRGLFLGSE